MNGIIEFQKTVKTTLLCLLTLCLVWPLGCSKKQDQQAKSPPQAQPQTKKSTQQKTRPAKTAFKADSNAPRRPRSSADSNLTARFRKAVEREVTRSLNEGKKTAKPSEANQLGIPGESDELTLERFAALSDPDEKIDFIMDFAEAHPESTIALVDKALDDNNVEVRSAAMEALLDYDSNSPEVIPVAARALKDSEEEIRQSAVQACASVDSPQVDKILLSALQDSSEEVRAGAIQIAAQKDAPVRLEILKAGITSSYNDVKTASVSSLAEISSPAAVDILITGLKDNNPEFHEEVKSALSFLLSQDFDTYNQAKSWWDANRNKFDDELSEKDE
jgi:hypothetical protein